MELKNLTFINPLSEDEKEKLNKRTEECYELILEETYIRACTNKAHWWYCALTSVLVTANTIAQIISVHTPFHLWLLNLGFIAFYMVTNLCFRNIFTKLFFGKKLPLVSKDTLNQCLEDVHKLRCDKTVAEILVAPETEEIYVTLTEDGICISRQIKENEGAILTKKDFLNVKKIKYDKSITKFIYDISDLSLTLYSEQDPMPKHLCECEDTPEK